MSILFAPAPDEAGVTLSGAKWYFYATGSLTPATTYTDSAKATPHTNPVVADSAGRFAAIYLDENVTYRAILKKSDGTAVKDIDPVNPDIADALSLDADDITGALGFTPADETVQINVGTLFTGGGALTDDVTVDLADFTAAGVIGATAAGAPARLTSSQGRNALGATTVGDAVFTAASAQVARATLSGNSKDRWGEIAVAMTGTSITTTTTFGETLSIVRNSTGNFTVTLPSAAASTNAIAVKGTASAASNNGFILAESETVPRTTSTVTVVINNNSNTKSDVNFFSVEVRWRVA